MNLSLRGLSISRLANWGAEMFRCDAYEGNRREAKIKAALGTPISKADEAGKR